jgi:hypothetical protein
MHSAKLGMATVVATLLAACSSPPTPSADSRSANGRSAGGDCYLASMIPPGTYRADTFTLGISSELAGVQQRFAETIARKQQWLQQYLGTLNLQPGQPLPYHEEMGVTRAEYEALVKAYTNPAIVPLETTHIDVQCSDGTTHFVAKPPHESLDQITIALDGSLHGLMNLSLKPEAISARKARFGTWSGTTWYTESGDATQGSVRRFELAVGKLDDSGRLVLIFQHATIENHKPIARDDLLTWLAKQ